MGVSACAAQSPEPGRKVYFFISLFLYFRRCPLQYCTVRVMQPRVRCNSGEVQNLHSKDYEITPTYVVLICSCCLRLLRPNKESLRDRLEFYDSSQNLMLIGVDAEFLLAAAQHHSFPNDGTLELRHDCDKVPEKCSTPLAVILRMLKVFRNVASVLLAKFMMLTAERVTRL